jgi:Ni,Fe-hydrogenase I large subunit
MSFGAMSLNEQPWERRSFFLPAGLVRDRDLTTVHAVDPMKIGEEVAHAWYTYGGTPPRSTRCRGRRSPPTRA